MKDLTIKAAILRILNEHGPLTMSQIYHLYPHAGGKAALESKLYIMQRRRDIRSTGRHECAACHQRNLRFRITDQGKAYLRHAIQAIENAETKKAKKLA